MNVHECVQTDSGRYVRLTTPIAGMIDIGDIAHALSQICRFGGHTRRFYSVAQHSVLVSNLVPAQYGLQGLLHDAAKAYFGEMVSPLKHMAFNREYRDHEGAMQAQIFNQFGLGLAQDDACNAAIRQADLVALATERRDLMPPDTTPWPILTGVTPCRRRIIPRGSVVAEYDFMSRFDELKAAL